MFTKGTKYIIQGGYDPLKEVGKFLPPKPSIFFIDDNPELRVKKRKNDAQVELEERLANEGIDMAEAIANSPTKKDKNEVENEDGTKTTVQSCGRIKFQGIVLPPEAPKDLICEECERAFAEYYCGACQEVYCFRCADLCHPKVSANDLMHAHERDGRIRSVSFGDTSRVKKLVSDEPFYLPDTMFFAEEYNQVRDLSQPNSLSTGVKDAKKEAILAPTSEPVKTNVKFVVNQLILFTDPAAEAPAYGKIVSQWDRTHGLSAPAIIRGGEAANYYIVQKLGLLVDTEDLESLLPKEKPSEDDKLHKKTSIYDPKRRLAKELDNAPLRAEQEISKKLMRKLKELDTILALGPKYHLRSVNTTNGKPAQVGDDFSLDGSEAGDVVGELRAVANQRSVASQRSQSLGSQSHFEDDDGSLSSVSTIPQPKRNMTQVLNNIVTNGNIKMRSNAVGSNLRPLPEANLQLGQLGPMTGKYMVNGDQVSEASRRSSMDGSVYNIHGSDHQSVGAGSETSVPTIDPREVIDQIEYRAVDMSVYQHLDLSLYADVDVEDQSVLSHFNANQRPLPASYRSYQHLVKDQVTKNKSNRLLDSLKEVMNNPNAANVAPSYDVINPEVTKEMLNILVLPETELECMKEKVAFYQARKEMILRSAMNKNDYIWLKVQVKWKFDVWKASLRELQERRRHFFARKIQSQARCWLCRNKLTELRQYWDNIAEQKRLKVHKKFRFTNAEDRYAVSFDNKLFFHTYADMNRYAYFLRVQCGKIIRNFNIKRLVILKQSITVWREAIYEFLESSLQNDHIQTNLLDIDQTDLPPSLRGMEGQGREEEMVFLQKEKIIQQHDQLLAFLSPLYYHTAYSQIGEGELGDGADMMMLTTGGSIGSGGGGIAGMTTNHPGAMMAGSKGGGYFADEDRSHASVASSSVASYRYYYDGYYDELGYENVTTVPLRIQSTYSEEEKKKLMLRDGSSDAEKKNVPAYDPGRHIPNLPPLFKLKRPKAFKDRLYHDLQQQLHLLPSKMRANYAAILSDPQADPATAANAAAAVPAKMPTGRSTSYGSLMTGPTTQSYWMVPQLLMVGNAPLGAAESKEFTAYDTVYNTGLFMMGDNPEKQNIKKKKVLPRNYDDIIRKKKLEKKLILSSMAALLLLGVNTFVSVMSEEEENMLLYFHDLTVAARERDEDIADEHTPNPPLPTSKEAKGYQVKSMKTRLEEEMVNVKATATRLIEEYTETIRKQEFNLTKIPVFGKSDPRYAASYREILRCEARVSIARSNIQKIRHQIKRVPKRIVYIRLPVSEYSTPWNKDMILPSVWMLEQLCMQRYDQLVSNVYPEESIQWIQEEEARIKRDAEERAQRLLEEEEERVRAKLEAEKQPNSSNSKVAAPPKAFRDSLNKEYESKVIERHENVYYVFGGGPHALHEDGLSKDGRSGLFAAILLARLYRLNPLEAIYRWQRAHDSMSIYSEKTPTPGQKYSDHQTPNKHFDTYKTPVPPLPWMRQLLIDTVQFSHRPLEPVTYRTQYNPDHHTTSNEDKNYDEDGKLKINNLRYDNTSVYQETTLENFNKGVKTRGGEEEEAKAKAVKRQPKSLSEMLHPVEEEKPKGPTEEDRIRYILFEKEYEEEFNHERDRNKQSLYFKQAPHS